MAIVLFLLVFAVGAGLPSWYCSYRLKVPTPYDICIDEYPPFGVRRFTCNGKEIPLYEILFVLLDFQRRNKLGFESRDVIIGKDGQPMPETEENRRKMERYWADRRHAIEGFQGEADADHEFMKRIPFAYRRTYFMPRLEH